MILYAAYVDGTLVTQVAAENEDTAFAKLKMEYPKLGGTAVFEIIDGNYHEEQEDESSTGSATLVKAEEKPKQQVKIIEADSVDITINITEGSVSKEDLEELEEAAEKGMVVAKTR